MVILLITTTVHIKNTAFKRTPKTTVRLMCAEKILAKFPKYFVVHPYP